MSKYTGLLFPVDEYHQIGPFRFPIYKDLVPGEARDIEDFLKHQSRSFYKSLKLAQRISKDKKIPTKQALDMLSSLDTDKGQQIVIDYAEELEALTENTVGETEQQIQFVTVLMRYRGQLQDSSGNWAPTTDWTEEDTLLIPKKILASIFQFIFWERDGWPTEGNAQEAPSPASTS